MQCQGYFYEEDSSYRCDNIINLTDQKLCQSCSDMTLTIRTQCSVYKGRFRCVNFTDAESRICRFCDYYSVKNEWLENFYLEQNEHSFKLYLNAFTWDQKILRRICKRMSSKTCQKILLDSDQFNDSFYSKIINRLHPKLLSQILEKFFLIKQIVIPDLIPQLMIPYTIRYSPLAIWNKHFSAVFANHEEEAKSLENAATILNNGEDIISKFTEFLATEGYKRINIDLSSIEDIGLLLIEAKNLDNLSDRAKLFLYAVKAFK